LSILSLACGDLPVIFDLPKEAGAFRCRPELSLPKRGVEIGGKLGSMGVFANAV